MALPTTTPSTAGKVPATGTGIRNKITVVAPLPRGSFTAGGFTGSVGSNPLQQGSFGSGNGNAVPAGGSGSFSFGFNGKPKANGIEKALGALGTGFALVQTAESLINTGAGVVNAVQGFISQVRSAGESLEAITKKRAEEIARNSQLAEAQSDSAKSEKKAVNTKPLNSDWRVRLGVRSLKEIFPAAAKSYLLPITEHGSNSVIFPYTPSIQVIHKANYNSQDPVHNNFSYQSYKNSGIDDIVINANFTVETELEGQYWLAATRFFKMLTKSFYGSASYPQGFPPPVAQLYGYGDHIFGGNGGLNVVVKSVSIDLPRNVQYKRIIYNGSTNYVPLDSNITITTSVVYSRDKLRSFNLNDYANGGQLGII